MEYIPMVEVQVITLCNRGLYMCRAQKFLSEQELYMRVRIFKIKEKTDASVKNHKVDYKP